MASARRPTKPRRCASKAAKSGPAPAQPSTSKPRAQGKPGPVSSTPSTKSRPLAVGIPSGSERVLVGKINVLRQRLQGVQDDHAAAEANCVRYAEEIERLNERLTARALAANQVTQLACKRLRSALGPLGQGVDERSTIGHMLAMIEQLIEALNARVETYANAFALAPGKISRAVAEASERLHVGSSEPRPQIEPPREFITSGLVVLPGSSIPSAAGLVGATITVVRADPPTADFAGIPNYGPRCEEKGQCEDLDGSGTCKGCGRWLGNESNEKPPTEKIAETGNDEEVGIGIGPDGEYTINGRKW